MKLSETGILETWLIRLNFKAQPMFRDVVLLISRRPNLIYKNLIMYYPLLYSYLTGFRV